MFFGKILRIDPHGTGHGVGGVGYGHPAAGNPFASDPNYAPEIWALGLRNPWRFSFDRQTGDLWIGDVGQDAREEIDLQPSSSSGGENYGWRVEEGDIARAGGIRRHARLRASRTASAELHRADLRLRAQRRRVDHRRLRVPRQRRSRVAGPLHLRRLRHAARSTALRKNGATWESTLLSDGDVVGPSLVRRGLGRRAVRRRSQRGLGLQAAPGSDQRASKTNTACVTKLNEGFAKLANTAVEADERLRREGREGEARRERHRDLQLERSQAREGRRQERGDRDEELREAPSFGYTSAANGNAAATDSESALAHDVFGDDLDLAIVSKVDDKDAAACQKAVLKGVASCQKTRRAEFVRCKKVGLKKATIADVDELAACLGSDPKGKIAKVVRRHQRQARDQDDREELHRARGRSLDAFPGCETDDPGASRAVSRRRGLRAELRDVRHGGRARRRTAPRSASRSCSRSTPTLRFGFSAGFASAPAARATVELAERLGFDSLWVGDHVAFPMPILDPLLQLALAAAHSERLWFGTSVYLVPLRHPVLIAKQVATLDLLCGGRFVFGVGVGGEFPREFEAVGVPVRERGARMSEALPLAAAAVER